MYFERLRVPFKPGQTMKFVFVTLTLDNKSPNRQHFVK